MWINKKKILWDLKKKKTGAYNDRVIVGTIKRYVMASDEAGISEDADDTL